MTLPALPIAAGPNVRSRLLAVRHAPIGAWVGGAVVVACVLLVVFAGQLAPYRATALSGLSLESPSLQHPLGTNLLGQDLASQLIVGARASLLVAVVAGAGTVLLGGIVGIAAGWFRGVVDVALMRLTDIVLVIPKLPLLLLVGALTGGSDITLAALIAATFWPMTARILRAQVLTLRTRTYVRASAGFGAGSWHQLRRHILPELGLLAIAELIPAAGRAVALQAGLAFLGVGDPSKPSWGAMMRDAMAYPGLFVTATWAWWLVPPIVALVSLMVGFALLGTSVETRLSPRVVRHHR